MFPPCKFIKSPEFYRNVDNHDEHRQVFKHVLARVVHHSAQSGGLLVAGLAQPYLAQSGKWKADEVDDPKNRRANANRLFALVVTRVRRVKKPGAIAADVKDLIKDHEVEESVFKPPP